ncbi:MAG: inosine/guanosine kinase [Pseudomonadota bacterium]
MRFPGKRKSKHYFPVSGQTSASFSDDLPDSAVYVVGMDQLLVDIEAHVDEELLVELGIPRGQSLVLDDATIDLAYRQLKAADAVVGEFAGGSIGNTMHNYAALADEQAVLLGAITRQITVGDYAFHYIRNTSSRVRLTHLHPVDGPMGRAICFVTPDAERSFGISRGIMDEFPPEAVPEEIVAGASALVLTAYLLRDDKAPICRATLRAIEIATTARVPVVLSLGTASLVQAKRAMLRELIQRSVTVLAGNLDELRALTGEDDPLLAGSAALDDTDLVLLTRDQHGLYLCGHVERELARETRDQIHSKSIPEYNRLEYSRAMRRQDCTDPVKIFSHINPYHGGARVRANTNGAGDAALAALLHDLAANVHHRQASPTSPKHEVGFLTYSSIHQICKYANRVSYEVLRRNAPRLMQGLPEREDSLEEAYWEA